MNRLPTYHDVVMAADRLAGHAVVTPLIRSDVIDTKVGKQVWFKPECNQKVGAFKYRGAFNRLSAMSEAERACGVVAYSSGNHAQGVSRAAKELGMSALIVMPSDAPAVKVRGVLADGAEIVVYDRLTESREDMADDIAARDGRIIVPSFDDPYIIAGQGTVGLEIAGSDVDFDALITCMGGGGLCAGISLAMGELSPRTKIYGAEPAGYNDHQKSLEAGMRVGLKNPPPTLCDALMTPAPGKMTWAINKDRLSGVYEVTDAQCLSAMKLAHEHLGVTLEPGGAVAMAAMLDGAFSDDDSIKTVCIILSGGNVDPSVLERALSEG
ncbi:threonine/serine dehydratase [Fretibacter rubidus]|uniref:threonine ammonia-lyase n=1 Tax=Fretibacter rubidus TaxID=570162 RepID=UPI00352B0919